MSDADLMQTPDAQRVGGKSLATAQAILFDLDGTLADTAPDLAAAANAMRRDRGLALVPLEALRRVASSGARGLLGVAFDIGPGHADFAAMREEFLTNYTADLCIETTLFPGIETILKTFTARGIRWGIVTNKAERLAKPLVAQLGLTPTADCVVGGDTTPHAKPHPAPLLHAATLIGVSPEHIIYVGDDLRDIQAGHAAGMFTIAAAYGYCGNESPPGEWGADLVIDTPEALAALFSGLA